MSQGRRIDKSRAIWFAVGISVLAHLVVLVVFLPPKFKKWSAAAKDKAEEEFEVTTSFEEVELEEQEVEPDQKQEELVEQKIQEPVEEEEPEPEPEPEPDPEKPEEIEIDVDRKVVQQQTNEEMPEEADYLSAQANKVEEETRARETTTKNVLPGTQMPEKIEEATGASKKSREGEQMASRAQPEAKPRRPEPARRPTASPKPQVEQAPSKKDEAEAEEGMTAAKPEESKSPVVRRKQGKPDPRKMLQPSAQDYEKVFGAADDQLEGQVKEETRGKRLMEGWEERQKMVRASLENSIAEVKPGNHTGVNAKPAVYASYIARIHRKLHPRWGGQFLPRLDTQYPRGHPLNDPTLMSELEYVIDARTGVMESVNIVQSSGELMFDAEALAISYRIGPFKNPPGEIVSPDGNVYVHWEFNRNQRQCGPFGASIFIVDNRKDTGAREPDVKVRGGGR